MSTHFESLQQSAAYLEGFGLDAPLALGAKDIWPRKLGFFIRHVPGDAVPAAMVDPTQPEPPAQGDATRPQPELALPVRSLCVGQFGLVPAWVKSASDAKLRSTKLVNARHETVTTSNNFRDAWLSGQRCIVPMMAFFEDDYRPGKAVPTRISRIDGKPMGAAGVWSRWVGAGDEEIISFTLLTVNANSHALMHRYQNPGAEKRMPVILSEGAYDAYLSARPEKAKEFMRPFAAERLRANPVERKADKIAAREPY
jgi:putative SOS response-associated peptidase YedK